MGEKSVESRPSKQGPPAPIIKPVSQIVLTARGDDLDEKLKAARNTILLWMQAKAGKIPPGAWQGENFALDELGSQPAKAVFLEQANYWAARLDDSDKEIAKRFWITEITLAKKPEKHELLFGMRVSRVTMGEDRPAWPSVPTFVRQVAEKIGGELDGKRIGSAPWLIDDKQKVKDLVSFLCNPKRTANVYVISLPDNSEDITKAIISADHLFHKIYGIGHVAVITGPAGYNLTDAVGKEFSVYLQAVRTYRPGLNLDESEPFEHPLALPGRMRNWPGGARNFMYFLANKAIQNTVNVEDLKHKLPPYTQIEGIYVEERQRKIAKNDADLQRLLDIKTKETNRIKYDYEDNIADNNSIVESYRQEKKQALSQVDALQARITYLESVLEKSKIIESDSLTIPSNFDDLRDWSKKHLAGKVVVSKKALKAAKKSDLTDVGLAYRALLVLRDFYVPMRRGTGIEKSKYEENLRELGLEESACFSGKGARAYDDEYLIDFGGERRELDRHLKGKNSRDPRIGFRLYFFYDDDSQQVVVGSFPKHLKTAIS